MKPATALVVAAVVLLGLAARAQQPMVTVRAGDNGVTAARLGAVERDANASVTRLAETFPGTPSQPFTVFAHSTDASLPEAARRGLHPGTPGMALLGRHEIHIVLDKVEARGPNALATVVAHEVVHELIDQYAGPAARWVPRWVHEGLAQVLSGDTYLGAREEDLYYPAATDRLLDFTELRTSFPEDEVLRRQAYAQSYSFIGFLCRRTGTPIVVRALRGCDDVDWYRGAFARAAGYPLGDELERWRLYLRQESGASWRVIFNNCFSYLMIGAFVLLALAGIRRWGQDAKHRDKLEREERMADDEATGDESFSEFDRFDELEDPDHDGEPRT